TQEQLIQAAKMQVVGSLASGVAHEVKNPLTIVLQGVEYLEKKISCADQNVYSVFNNIKIAVERADSIIRGLLDFSRISKLDMEMENINSLCERSLSLLKHQFDKCRIQVINDMQPDIPTIKIDRNKIEQVLINLLMNALQASSEGGKIIVRTYFKNSSKEVILEIEDNGSGLPEAALSKIFDPFFTTKRAKGGTGLGLSVVKSIVGMHNGKIEIKNNRSGKGAIAILTFKT
ncbi:MAG: ATP-binding protein, partial [Candidatus Omnitrophica bacterium]|nr:ATP-binding protein [Candidatus Omnitrophota bacterium]